MELSGQKNIVAIALKIWYYIVMNEIYYAYNYTKCKPRITRKNDSHKTFRTMKNLNKKLTAVSIGSFIVIFIMVLYLMVSEWVPADCYVYIIEFLLGVGILSGVLAIIRKCTGAADYDNM